MCVYIFTIYIFISLGISYDHLSSILSDTRRFCYVLYYLQIFRSVYRSYLNETEDQWSLFKPKLSENTDNSTVITGEKKSNWNKVIEPDCAEGDGIKHGACVSSLR